MAWWNFGKKADLLGKTEDLVAQLEAWSGSAKKHIKTATDYELSERRLGQKLRQLVKKEKDASEKVIELVQRLRNDLAAQPNALKAEIRKRIDLIVAQVGREKRITDDFTETVDKFRQWNSAVGAAISKAEALVDKQEKYLEGEKKRTLGHGMKWPPALDKGMEKLRNALSLLKEEFDEIGSIESEIDTVTGAIKQVTHYEMESIQALYAALRVISAGGNIDLGMVSRHFKSVIQNEKRAQILEESLSDMIKRIRGLVDLTRFKSKEARRALG
jgi:dsDNA-binding SOS-regulon protein